MARDRQRAKQRRQRRAAQNPGPAPGRLHRDNVPGELDHASGQVEQFEASLVAGSGGQPAEEEVDVELGEAEDVEVELREAAAADYEPEPVVPDEEAAEAAEPSGAVAVPQAARVPAPTGNRVMAFLRASWAELQRVQWPDRRQVAQATAVVLGFVLIAGAYLGLADLVAQRIVDFII